MVRTWSIVFALAACRTSGGDDYTVVPGGAGNPSGGTNRLIDAASASDGDAGDGGAGQRVCLINDLRKLTACAGTGAGGLKVTLGSLSATTIDDGSFVLAKPSGDLLTWHVIDPLVNNPKIVTTVMPYSAQTLLPVIDPTTYRELVNANSLPMILDQQGSLVVAFKRMGVPVAGVKVTLAPPSANKILYDTTSATQWSESSTGAFGIMWAPGIAVGPQSFTVSGTTTGGTVGIENQAITIVTQEVP